MSRAGQERRRAREKNRALSKPWTIAFDNGAPGLFKACLTCSVRMDVGAQAGGWSVHTHRRRECWCGQTPRPTTTSLSTWPLAFQCNKMICAAPPREESNVTDAHTYLPPTPPPVHPPVRAPQLVV